MWIVRGGENKINRYCVDVKNKIKTNFTLIFSIWSSLHHIEDSYTYQNYYRMTALAYFYFCIMRIIYIKEIYSISFQLGKPIIMEYCKVCWFLYVSLLKFILILTQEIIIK